MKGGGFLGSEICVSGDSFSNSLKGFSNYCLLGVAKDLFFTNNKRRSQHKEHNPPKQMERMNHKNKQKRWTMKMNQVMLR